MYLGDKFDEFEDNFGANVKETCSLIGTEFLRVTTTTLFHLQGATSHKDYPLRKVTKKELLELRFSGTPGFVLKSGKDLFYTEIPNNLRFNGSHTPYKHLCGEGCKRVCNHCPKVDDWTKDFHQKRGRSFKKSVFLSGRIEKYDFIPTAFESFNTSLDAYGIIECNLFTKDLL